MMYDIFDANELLFQALNVAEVKALINGAVYNGSRPLNSQKQDIVVNTITITQQFTPQTATSNINIYTQDLTGPGIPPQNVAKMKAISRKVVEIMQSKNYLGKSVYIVHQGILQDANNNEHYLNLRLQWKIYDTK